MGTGKIDRFSEGEGIGLFLLFGSRAKGGVRQGSDWDVGVLKREGSVEADA